MLHFESLKIIITIALNWNIKDLLRKGYRKKAADEYNNSQI